MHDASISWRLAYEERVTRESEERIKSEALVYMITHWLLYALGQA